MSPGLTRESAYKDSIIIQSTFEDIIINGSAFKDTTNVCLQWKLL